MVSNEHPAILEAITAYLNAIKTGAHESFQRAFHPEAVVINANEANPQQAILPIAKFSQNVMKRHEAGIASEEIPLGISVNHIGKIANVRIDFKLTIGPTTYYGTDFMNMIKRDERWKIAQKIYYVTRSE